MAERFEILVSILRDWGKEKVQKKSRRCIELVLEAGWTKKTFHFLENHSEKNTPAVSVSSRARSIKKQNWSPNPN